MRPRISQEKLARQLGVSRATVSYVLSGVWEEKRVSPDMARKVLDLAREMGYVPNLLAKSLQRQRTGIIGVVVINFMMDWVHRMHQGVRVALQGTGTTPIFVPRYVDPKAERKELEWMLQHRVDGVIICVPMQENRDYYPSLAKQGMPVVFLGDVPTGAPRDSNFVLWDSAKAVGELVEKLIASGRKRPVWATYGHKEVMSLARYAAYRETALHYGLSVREDHDLIINLQEDLDHLDERVRDWLKKRFRSKRTAPDAIVCIVDVLAETVLRQLREMEISVPRDVVVTGVGDFPLSGSAFHDLVTIREPTGELGRLSTEVLLALIDDPSAAPMQRVLESVEILDRPGALEIDAPFSPIARETSALATTLERSLVK